MIWAILALCPIVLSPFVSSDSVRSPCPEIFQYGKENGKDVGFLDISVPKIQIYGFNVTLVFFVPETATLKDDSINISLRYNSSEIVRKVLNGRRVSYVAYFEGDALQLSEIFFSRQKICELDEDEQPTGHYKIITAFKAFKAEIDVVAEYNRIFNIGVSEGKCGQFEKNIVEFSIGGERANKLNWPWVTSMYVKGNHVCSATLIDKSVAITAAHCLEPNGFPAAVADIELVLFSNETVKIWLFVKHPYHQGPGKNDIALLFLEYPIKNALFVPVCLWEFYEDIENRPGKIVGFGETEFADSGDINKLNLHAVSSDTCAKSHEKLAALVNSQTFCAGGPDGTGPCRGDSGGGFMIKEGTSWYLRGVVSAGLENEYHMCDTENYVVFMDVVKYLDWITNRKQTLKKKQDQPKKIEKRSSIVDSKLDRKQQVFCYIGEWHLDITDKIMPGLCTMIYIWFASVDANGTIQADNVRRLHNFLDLKPRYAAKIILSLGGYADYTTKENMRLIAASSSLQKKFAKSCLDVCEQYELDGIDIHWEYPHPQDQAGYVEMAREAIKLLNPAGYLLTIGGPADINRSGPSSGLRIKELSEVTNYINLITHDYHGDSSEPWSGGGLNINAPINAKDRDSVEDTLKRYFDAGVAPGKLTLGIPMYGRWWRMKDKHKNTIGSPFIIGKQNDYAFAPAFHDYCRNLNDSTWTVVRPTLEVAPYMYRDQDWISFEDFKSLEDRADIVTKYGLAGVKIWSFEQDDYDNICKYECPFPLMRTINNRIGRKIDCDFIDPNRAVQTVSGEVHRTPIRDHELERKGQTFCYISIDRQNFTASMQQNLCNFVTLMFVSVDAEGKIIIKNETNLQNKMSLRAKFTFKILVSIGGPADNAAKSNFQRIAASRELRKAFSENCLDICKKYDLDGIDIHWEYPDQRFKELFVSMTREVHKLLTPAGYLLTVAAPASNYWSNPSNGFDIKGIAAVTHYIHLLGHDFHLDENTESSGGGTDINAPINSPDEDAVEDAIKRYVKLIPANRIVLSIPFYARWWKLKDRNRTEIGAPYISGHQGLKEGVPAYYEYCQYLNDSSWTIVRPELEVAPFMYRDNDWLSFEDVESIKIRGHLIQKYGLAGARLYGLDQDDFDNRCKSECAFPLTRAMKKALGVEVDCNFKSKTSVILLNASKSDVSEQIEKGQVNKNVRPIGTAKVNNSNEDDKKLTSGANVCNTFFCVIMFSALICFMKSFFLLQQI